VKKLFLDIETSPHVVYTWSLYDQHVGMSQIISPTRVLCMAYAFDDGPMKFVSEWGRGGRHVMISTIHGVLSEADAVIHYNGTSFDEKHLNREMLQEGFTPPAPYETIDIYRTIKQRFRFASSKLAQVAAELELNDQKIKTDFGLWKGVLGGDRQSRAEMRRYNIQDVELLRELYPLLLPWINRHPNVALYEDGEAITCTRCGSTNLIRDGYKRTSAGRFQRYSCNDCGGYSRGAKRLVTTPLREA
jgi:hypothetical protein